VVCSALASTAWIAFANFEIADWLPRARMICYDALPWIIRVWFFGTSLVAPVHGGFGLVEIDMGFDFIDRQFKKPSAKADTCECCDATNGVALHPSFTAYEWDGVDEDPNAPRLLCDACGKENYEYWTERWAQYHAGLL
jgi:hypothetical protein